MEEKTREAQVKQGKTNKVKVIFYLNPIDKDLIKDQSEMLQITPSFFIRNAVLEKLSKPIFEKKVQNLETKNYLSALVKIGSNLNQIARKLNSNAKFLIADQQSVLKDISEINNHILEIKSKI
jgi:uncharacterized protein with von Willebrand factor type A (vWA) domain